MSIHQRKSRMVLNAGFAFALVLAGGCSSDQPLEPTEKVTSDDEINEAIEEIPAGAEAVGLLTFFPGEERGVVIKGIKWSQPLSSENPGADCELKSEKDATYTCSVKKGVDTVSLRITEVGGGTPRLNRIFLTGAGRTTRERWINQLGINGYVRQGQRAKDGSTRYFYASGDRGSRAELNWNPKTEVVSVTLGPPPK